MKITKTPNVTQTTLKVLRQHENVLRPTMCVARSQTSWDSPFIPALGADWTDKSPREESEQKARYRGGMEDGNNEGKRLLTRQSREQYLERKQLRVGPTERTGGGRGGRRRALREDQHADRRGMHTSKNQVRWLLQGCAEGWGHEWELRLVAVGRLLRGSRKGKSEQDPGRQR